MKHLVERITFGKTVAKRLIKLIPQWHSPRSYLNGGVYPKTLHHIEYALEQFKGRIETSV